MKAAIEAAVPGVRVELIKSKGGAFEIRRDDELIFSKKRTGRFPSDQEIVDALKR